MAVATAEQTRIREAYLVVRDLFTPDPRRYWRELVVTGIFGWIAAAVAITGVGGIAVTVAAVLVAALIWHRATLMVHELTHQRREELPGFHLAWNLVIGVAWLFPSVMYERVHNCHHRKTTYGTLGDPEYLPLAGRPWAVAGYLVLGLFLFPLLFLRFMVLAPLAWFLPPVRRFVNRHGSSYAINPWFARSMTDGERRRMVRWELIIFAAWAPLLALTVAGVLPWRWLVVWYVIHTSVTVLNKVRMLSAHHFASDGSPTDHLGQFRDSVDTPGGWWTEAWAPLGLRYHALHHMFPTLPFHNMRTGYERLTAHFMETGYPPGTGRGFVATMRALLTASPTPQKETGTEDRRLTSQHPA